jgi:hypothetical protein
MYVASILKKIESLKGRPSKIIAKKRAPVYSGPVTKFYSLDRIDKEQSLEKAGRQVQLKKRMLPVSKGKLSVGLNRTSVQTKGSDI